MTVLGLLRKGDNNIFFCMCKCEIRAKTEVNTKGDHAVLISQYYVSRDSSDLLYYDNQKSINLSI